MIPGPFSEFDRWADDQRAQLDRIIAQSKRTAAEARAIAGDYDPTDPGPISTEPLVREPRMPWDSPRDRTSAPHEICLTANCRRCAPARASLVPLLTWALVVFLAGLALGALLSTSYRSFAVEGSAARAGLMVEAPALGPVATQEELGAGQKSRATARIATVEHLPSVEPARATTSHADDVLSAESASPRDDPPAAVVPTATHSDQFHGFDFSTSIEEAKPQPLRAVLRAIHRAALEFGQHPGRMVGVAYCESSFDPAKVGDAGERGIWQFMAATWSENAPRLGYAPEHITDVVASSRVAADMWSRGLSDRWTCAR